PLYRPRQERGCARRTVAALQRVHLHQPQPRAGKHPARRCELSVRGPLRNRPRHRLTMRRLRTATVVVTVLCCGPALAQHAPAHQPAAPPPVTWESLPRLQLEQQFAGPLKDTAIQRWRDPQANVLCYVYLPFTAAHSAPTATSYVQYGPNTIGS